MNNDPDSKPASDFNPPLRIMCGRVVPGKMLNFRGEQGKPTIESAILEIRSREELGKTIALAQAGKLAFPGGMTLDAQLFVYLAEATGHLKAAEKPTLRVLEEGDTEDESTSAETS